MIKKKWLVLLFCLYVLTGGYTLFHITASIALPKPDMAAVNRILKSTQQQLISGVLLKEAGCPYDYTVLTPSGKLLYQSADGLATTVEEAVKSFDTVLTVESTGRVLGYVLINMNYKQLIFTAKQQLTIAIAVFMLLTILFLFLIIGYLDSAILRPFAKLKGFARHVAMGNFDIPLPMDKNHSFGAFTESFDLMRDQIKEARQKEAEANKSKKELTASLSHDIKTPVTSIKLVSELLLAIEPEGKTRERIQTIYQKTEQIDLLVSNLLQASLEDLGELTVHMTEESSHILAEIIREADCFGTIDCAPIPGCILNTDRQRLCQVLDNVIYNSCKYAATSIRIDFSLSDHNLILTCRDYGKGVPEEELPFLFQKYYRGSNSRTSLADGSGLGLFIAHYLMKKMNGDIQCYNLVDGFCTELVLPLTAPSSLFDPLTLRNSE